MITPVRLKLSRAPGFRLHALSDSVNGLEVVHVARPGPRGNPFQNWMGKGKDECGKPYEARLFRRWLAGLLTDDALFAMLAGDKNAALARAKIKALGEHRTWLLASIGDLRGKNIACWCGLCAVHQRGKPLDRHCPDCPPCHGDALGEHANGFVCEVPQ